MACLQNKNHVTDIAVIGLSCRFPKSKNISDYWENLKAGEELIQRATAKELDLLGVSKNVSTQPNFVNACGFLDNIDKFDNELFQISSTEAAAMDPQQRILIEEAYHALENAGYCTDKYAGKIGIFAGSGTPHYYHELIKNNALVNLTRSRQLLYQLGNEKDFLAPRIAHALNLTGPAISLNLASATGLAVIVKACQSLANKEADIMLACAASVILPSQFGYLYEPGNILSFDGHCRPFDAESNGTVLGSGAGAVVLKRLDEARKDNDIIHAIIKGYAINNDGKEKMGFTAPTVTGQAACINKALSMSNIDPTFLKYIEAHGTGTMLGDPIEIAALATALNDFTKNISSCAIGSVKGNIGHAQSASGMAGFIKLVLSIKNKAIPASLNFKNENKKINFNKTPFFVNTKLKKWNDSIRIGAVNSLAMGGTNVHVVVANHDEFSNEKTNKPKPCVHVIPISANDMQSLKLIKNNLLLHLSKLNKDEAHNESTLCSLAYTLQLGRKDLPARSAYLCKNIDDLILQLKTGVSLYLDPSADTNKQIEIKDRWLLGEEINWNKLQKTKPKTLLLPNYPFCKKSHWLLNNIPVEIKENQNSNDIKVATSNSITRDLMAILQSSFNIKDIKVGQKFSDLGCDSLLALDIISKIEKAFKVRISIQALLDMGSIDNLRSLIEKKSKERPCSQSLILLNEFVPTNPTAYIVHPGSGEIYPYKQIAALINQKVNLVGIFNPVFNDSQAKNSISIKSLAQSYIKSLKDSSYSSEQFILCGWSFGGTVAFEMTHQLESKGEKVTHLLLIDSWSRYSSSLRNRNYFFKSYLKKISKQHKSESSTNEWAQLLWKRMRSLFNYIPNEINANTTLLKADEINDEYVEVNTLDNHWQEYCRTTLSTILISGNHESMLQQPGSNQIARIITQITQKTSEKDNNK